MPSRKRFRIGVAIVAAGVAAGLIGIWTGNRRDPLYDLVGSGCVRVFEEHTANRSLDKSGWRGTLITDMERFVCEEESQTRIARLRKDLPDWKYVRGKEPASAQFNLKTGPAQARLISVLPHPKGSQVVVYFLPTFVSGPSGLYWKWVGRPAWLAKNP
ncbi:hypothetical protein EON81_08335 [bacterium]|nr:MAG: hypothetical protein EON81_08335 [bacterium]